MSRSASLIQGDIIDTNQALSLLKVSRPTFLKYRKKYDIADYKIRKKIFFSKQEVLEKIYGDLFPVQEKLDFLIGTENDFDELIVVDHVYDLRRIGMIDGHGGVGLVCEIMSIVRKKEEVVHLIVDDSNDFLHEMNFFGALRQHKDSKIFWKDADGDKSIELGASFSVVKLPITRLGVVGAHHQLTDSLIQALSKQNYSEEICGYIGWAMGELADNAATHAKVYPCFAYLEQFGENKKYLQFTIGDIGVGIPKSLKSNPRHSQLSDREALLSAFRPYFSGRDDEEKRGKGLTDILKIAMECSSSLKVESHSIGYSFSFNLGVDNFHSYKPLFKREGTLISLLFIDDHFSSVKRTEIDKYLLDCMEKL